MRKKEKKKKDFSFCPPGYSLQQNLVCSSLRKDILFLFSPLSFFFFFFYPFHIIKMAQIFDSRKPEPYIKSSCKKCITPIEFYPQGQAVGQKVSVKCWACEQVETYTVTEPITSTPQTESKSSASKARSSRKKGTGKILRSAADHSHSLNSFFDRSKPYIH